MNIADLFLKFRGLFPGVRPVGTQAEFTEFIAAQSAFIAQKCVVEYCRARAGVNWEKLFFEKAFLAALEACRWEAYALVLADVVVLAEGRLRGPAGTRASELPDALVRHAESALLHFGPATTDRGSDWTDVLATLRPRLVEAQLAEPKRAHEIALTSGGRVYKLLPVHPQIRAYDRELVTNNIRFNMCHTADAMDRRFVPGLAGALLPPAAAAA